MTLSNTALMIFRTVYGVLTYKDTLDKEADAYMNEWTIDRLVSYIIFSHRIDYSKNCVKKIV